MRAMVFDHYSERDVMCLRDVPVREPQEGEVLIRVGYAGVNPADSKTHAGHSHARSIDIDTSTFHSSQAWMPPVSWNERGRVSPNSGQEIA
jgi:NADPH:quinone reductase-like Zn-dependent oxidoreductase